MPDRPMVLLLTALCLWVHGTTTPVAAGEPQDDVGQKSQVAADRVSFGSPSDPAQVPSFGSAAFADLFGPNAEPVSLSSAAAAVQPPPEPHHTGFSALVHSTASDFAAFPRRKSTWVILGIGGAAAALVYPADDEINEWMRDADGLRKVLKPGKYLATPGYRAAPRWVST